MKIRLEAPEIEAAVKLYLDEVYARGHVSKIEITTMQGKNYSDPLSYMIEADVSFAVPESE